MNTKFFFYLFSLLASIHNRARAFPSMVVRDPSSTRWYCSIQLWNKKGDDWRWWLVVAYEKSKKKKLGLLVHGDEEEKGDGVCCYCCVYDRERGSRQSRWLRWVLRVSAICCFFLIIKVPTPSLSIQVKRLKMKRPKTFFQPKTYFKALLRTTERATQKQGLDPKGRLGPDPLEPDFFRVQIISGFGSKFCVQNPKLSGGFGSGFRVGSVFARSTHYHVDL